MSRAVLRSLSIVTTLALSGPVLGQSAPLGLNFVEAELTYRGNDGGNRLTGRISSDFKITEAHGLQLDVTSRSYPGGMLGQIDAHLYMVPQDHLKCGLFLSLADVNEREATIGTAGIEVMADIGDRPTVQAKIGLGMARSRPDQR